MGSEANSTNLSDVSVTINNSASAYTTGKQIGTAQKIPNVLGQNGSGILVDILVNDLNKKSADMDLYFFDRNPTLVGGDTSTFDQTGANAALQRIGIVSIAAGDWKTDNTNASVNVKAIYMGITSNSGPQLGNDCYVVAVCRGSFTWTTASAISVRLKSLL